MGNYPAVFLEILKVLSVCTHMAAKVTEGLLKDLS